MVMLTTVNCRHVVTMVPGGARQAPRTVTTQVGTFIRMLHLLKYTNMQKYEYT